MSKVIRFDTVKSDTNSLPIIKGRIFEYPSMSEGASKIIVSAPDYHFETFTKLLDNSYQIKLPRQAIYTIKYACLGYEEVIIENVKLIIGYVYIIDIGLSMKTH